MRRQMIYNRLLHFWLPEVIDSKAPFGIANIATVFDMPIDIVAATLPIDGIGIAATGRILDSVLYL